MDVQLTDRVFIVTGGTCGLGRATAFLLSPAASYVTGQTWAVDGGATRAL